MNVARMNFSHGTHEYHAQTIANLRATCLKTDKLCAVMLDTKGPEIRTIKLKGTISAEPCYPARRPSPNRSFPSVISTDRLLSLG
jgi:pyruvate kinase